MNSSGTFLTMASECCSQPGAPHARWMERTTPGSRASRKRASVRGRGAVTVRLFRSWSSFSCENRASWNDGDGWVETCASALTMELLLRILCAGQTKSIKESWPFTPARRNRVIGRSDHRAIGQKRRLLLCRHRLCSKATSTVPYLEARLCCEQI